MNRSTNTNTYGKLKQALTLANFDGRRGQAMMNMSTRVRRMKRPSDMSGKPRVGAVLMLVYLSDGEPHVVYTKRPSTLKDHSGQISFPGGKVEPGETWLETAQRETFEEIGVGGDQVEIVGELTDLYIPPSDFEVHPFVGWCATRPNFHINLDEVETLIEAPLSLLLDPATVKHRTRTFERYGSKMTLDVPYFDVFGHQIWGATAIMTGEFLTRWREVE